MFGIGSADGKKKSNFCRIPNALITKYKIQMFMNLNVLNTIINNI